VLICECGEIIDGGTFRDYIKTSASPSSPTIGHRKCGHIFNFIDQKMSMKYSSKIELKSIAMRFALKNNIKSDAIEKFFVQVDKLKSSGNLSDSQIIIKAFQNIVS
jgi:hypothetical protein